MRLFSLFMIVGAMLVTSCSQTSKVKKPYNNPLIVGFNKSIDFKNLKKGHIAEGVEYVIAVADEIKNEIIAVSDSKRSYENTLLRLDDIYNIIESVWSPGYLMGSVHTDEEIRNEGLDASKTIQNYITDLSLDEDLYNAILMYSKTKDAQNLRGYKKKFLDDTLLGYKRTGFNLSSEDRAKVKEALDRLTDLGLEFDKNIRGAQDTLFLDEPELNGLPDNYKKELIYPYLIIENNMPIEKLMHILRQLNGIVLKRSRGDLELLKSKDSYGIKRKLYDLLVEMTTRKGEEKIQEDEVEDIL